VNNINQKEKQNNIMIKFYRNVEVEIVKEIDENDVLIKIPIVGSHDDSYEIYDPDFMLEIVNKKHITDTKIELFKEYNDKINTIKCEINKLNIELNNKKKEYDKYNEHFESKRKIYKEVDILFKFLDKKINYAVVKKYHSYDLCSLKDAITTPKNNWDSFGGDIKLLTLFGDSNGNLQYKINQYRDGSGSCNDNVWFFETEDEAKIWMLNKLEQDIENIKYWSLEELINMKNRYNLNSDIIDNRIKELQEIVKNNNLENIKKLEEEIEKIKKEM
jgi:hypothetical protein